MKGKIGFVTPWYGENIPGGAEAALRDLVHQLFLNGDKVEILTTCVKQFASDWNTNYYEEGVETVGGVVVRRFKVRIRNVQAFDAVRAKLMRNMAVTDREERLFIREMINSPALYNYIKEHNAEYTLFVFIPYMFGTTYYGIMQAPWKSVLIPCFHDEKYVYLNIYKKVFRNLAGVIYLSSPEYELANAIFDLSHVKQAVLGTGLETEVSFDAVRFRAKYRINSPFILYAGRKDVGKNVYTLCNYFREFKMRNKNCDIKLVLIGGGEIHIDDEMRGEIIDFGFVEKQDKYDAYSAATVLCQPSKNESFSLVIMESWLCKRPVLVHSDCNVTRDFAIKANGGLYFGNYPEFQECIRYFLRYPQNADILGKCGRKFVIDNYSWDVVLKKYISFFEDVSAHTNS